MAMAYSRTGLSIFCLLLIAILPSTHGEACGLENLNEHSIVVVGEIKGESRTNNSHFVIVRVLETVYGETLNGEVKITQIDKARSCGHLLKTGDQRIFVIESRPGHKKFTLVSTLSLALKHLAENAKWGKSCSVLLSSANSYVARSSWQKYENMYFELRKTYE